jgi:hypothetical protein
MFLRKRALTAKKPQSLYFYLALSCRSSLRLPAIKLCWRLAVSNDSEPQHFFYYLQTFFSVKKAYLA